MALAAALCGASSAGLAMFGGGEAASQLPDASLGPLLDGRFCQQALLGRDLIVPDAQRDVRFADAAMIRKAPFVRFFAGVPLIGSAGGAIGILCVLDRRRRARGLTREQRSGLHLLARQLARLVERSGLGSCDPGAGAPPRDRLRWLSTHDPLTGLFNRARFHEALAQALRLSDGEGDQTGLLMVNVDHMKQINASHGQDGGDALLRAIAERLSRVVRSGDLVARLGGDEFGILLPHVGGEVEAHALADTILRRVNGPVMFGATSVECRASLGLALHPAQGVNADELLTRAGLALERCKARGGGGVEAFRPEMLDELQRRTAMISLARRAVRRERITPHYQPKVDLRSGKIVGFEALLRWQGAGAAVHHPATIAAAFAEPELAIAIADQMAREVATDMRQWLDAGVDFGTIALNAGAAEFNHGDLASRLLGALDDASVPPRRLEVEVTESVLVGRGAAGIDDALHALRAAGVSIAFDDFGTGFAALSHLRHYPVDCLKLDQSFVRGLDVDARCVAIVRAVLELAHRLGIATVAEGVERAAQRDFLRRHGCHMGQGFLFGAAVPASELPRLLSASGGHECRRMAA